jgi:TRAP-type C4-dicarboxylate transport system permease small subunit
MSQAATMPSDFGRLRTAYGHFLTLVVSVLMVTLFIEVTLGVIFRTIGQPLVWYDEVASILLAWLTFYGSALASFNRAHIGCPEIVDMCAPKFKRALGVVSQIIVIIFFGTLGWYGMEIMPILATDFMSSLPDVSMAVAQSVIPISAGLILIGEFLALYDLLVKPIQD